MTEITTEQRQNLRKWTDALSKLKDHQKEEEAEDWIISSLNILNISQDEVSE